MSRPIALRDIVTEVMQGLGVDKKSKKEGVVEVLGRFLGRKASGHIKAQHYQNQKLVINVDSSVWLYKLKLEEKIILDKLNNALPELGIKEVVFRLGRV
ncbi:MAG: DciA family protein [Candidatus Omnitrophota bacterium]|nr:DciA family protein [Candidatus Omnitrophota bacterium]